jgi:protein SCO1
MSKKKWFYIGFFAVLTGIFLFALTKMVPGFGEVKLPVLGYVKPFSFTNQEGKTITQSDVQSKVYVVEYFFTTCKGICPKMNKNMQGIYAEFKAEPGFLILSHTVDPATDTVAQMKRYADSLGADPARWWFLTGTKDSLYTAARASYLLDDPRNNNMSIDEQFIHTQFFALVDKGGRVRAVYDGLKEDEIKKLRGDIKALLIEKEIQKPFVNNLFNNNPN